jgi:DNA-binding GntR family transcriptional regulator
MVAWLSQDYGVALTTVRKALDALKAEGLVVTSPMGTFVARQQSGPASRGRLNGALCPACHPSATA